MADPKLALRIDEAAIRLQLSYGADELAAAEAGLALAEDVLAADDASGRYRPATRDRHLAERDDWLALIAYITPRLVSPTNPGTAPVRAGDVWRIDDELVAVDLVLEHEIEVFRAWLGSRAAGHAADTELERFVAAPLDGGGLLVELDGGGSALAPGRIVDVPLPFAGAFSGWTLLADQAGDLVLDVLRDPTFPPTSSITGLTPPTLATADHAASTDLTDWTTGFAAGDYLRVIVASVSAVNQASLLLRYQRA